MKIPQGLKNQKEMLRESIDCQAMVRKIRSCNYEHRVKEKSNFPLYIHQRGWKTMPAACLYVDDGIIAGK